MNRIILYPVVAACCLWSVTAGAQSRVSRSTDPVDYVDPNIGGIGHLLQPTLPTVQLPHGMIRVAPLKSPGMLDQYLADRIEAFPVTITSHRIASAFAVTATSGPLSLERGRTASRYDHDNETVTPYRYAVLLEDHDITAEYSVTEHAVFYRYTFGRGGDGNIILRTVRQGGAEVILPATIRAHEDLDGVRCYIVAVASKPFDRSGTIEGAAVTPGGASVEGKNAGVFASYRVSPSESIDLRVGFSFIGFDQAESNLKKEIPDWNFSRVSARARKLWNDALGKIRVSGGSEKQKRIFYTALYRAHERMVNTSEYGRYFSGYDGKVHADSADFYVDDWLWDTYRSLHPLQLLIEPERSRDMLRSYVRMYEQSGWMPSFPLFRGDHACMIGHHAASIITDAYLKGMRGLDIEKAYEGLKKNAMEATMLPWANGPKTGLDDVYMQKGFFPALEPGSVETVKEVHGFERRQSVAVTLEHAYDDWCLAQLAQALNKPEDYAYFSKRALNYRNLFDSRTGFMSPKTADGKWIEHFDPKLSGGQGGRAYFAECNSWTYTWSVQHDIAGLINLMGGRERAADRLDAMFDEPLNTDKFTFLGQFPDASGLNGQFAMGDEPSFHIPYLYNYVGQPWKAQKRLRQLMEVWFDDDPLGICGDEDGGAMSSWYVFSALGFYPVSPGRPVYDIGSPIFPEATIILGKGKKLVIKALHTSKKNKYVQSVTINGTPLTKPWFRHDDIKDGGTLVLVMGPRPNREWGSASDDAPPSMTPEIAGR